MSKIYAKGYVSEVKSGGGITGAVASTGSLDRDGEVLDPMGWELENFKKAPRLLWSHKALDLPIGRVDTIYVDPKTGDLKFDATFAEKENDFAKKVADLMRGGFLNTFSVGFIPKERNGDIYTKQELLEISVVNVPANPEARTLSLYKSLEKELEQIEEKDAEIHHKPEPDITENHIRIRVEDPDKFVDGSFRTIDLSKEKGIRSVIGKYKDDPSGPTHVQSYLFDKDKWSVAEAEAWVKDHKYFDGIVEKIAVFEDNLMMIKEGRIISEKNRLLIRTAIDTMKQANIALDELLNSTEPPKKGDGEKKVGNGKAVKKDGKNNLLRALRIVDKAVEYSIQQVKKS
jgi:HK97 family phage prohead protease